MPSMEPDDGAPAPRAGDLRRRRSRGELLEHIYAEGARRRRRRRAGALSLSASALAVVAGVVLTANLPGGTPQQVATRGQGAPPSAGSSTSSSAVAPSTTIIGDSPVPTSQPTATTRPVPTTARTTGTGPAPSTTTRLPTTDPDPADPDPDPTTTTQPPSALASSRCVNSTDPACGPFHWQPEPGPNSPLVIEVTATPRPNDPMTSDFAIVYSDADAPIVDGCRSVGFGDGDSTFTGSARSCAVAACLVPYGAWAPPTPQVGRAEATVSHTFSRAGTFEVSFTAMSRHSLCQDPYASSATRTIIVVVP